jgi:hypothetical protein
MNVLGFGIATTHLAQVGMIMKSGFWHSVLSSLTPAPSAELQAAANRLNRMGSSVRVSSKGAVVLQTNAILGDPDFIKACEEAQSVIRQSA